MYTHAYIYIFIYKVFHREEAHTYIFLNTMGNRLWTNRERISQWIFP